MDLNLIAQSKIQTLRMTTTQDTQNMCPAQCAASTFTPLFVWLQLEANKGHAFKVFVNLVRWLHTVVRMNLLPPLPPAPLLDKFCRPSPYGAGISFV